MLLSNIKLLKNKKRSGTNLRLIFYMIFWRKIFLIQYFITWPNFIAWLSLLLWILGNKCIVIICCQICNVLNFEISFPIKPFFYATKKSVLVILGTPVSITEIFSGKVFCHILKQINRFVWSFKVGPLNHFSAKFNHLR